MTRLKSIVTAIAILLGIAGVCAAQPSGAISVQERRLAIRSRLLKFTPIGSTIQYVQMSIQKNLLRPGESPPSVQPHLAINAGAKDTDRQVAKSIRLRLGEYLADAAIALLSMPLIKHKEVFAEWTFNRKDRLIDVSVEKISAIY